jgi:hypothetical protein
MVDIGRLPFFTSNLKIFVFHAYIKSSLCPLFLTTLKSLFDSVMP